MSKVLFGCLIAGVLAFASGCKGGAEKSDGAGCGCSAEAACGAGCGCGCNACGEGCTTSCGCGGGCACGGGCGDACGCGCGDACSGGCGGGCGCGGATTVTDADARHAMRRFREYLTWTKANAKRFKSKPHNNLMISNYVNNLARDSWTRKRAFPVGAVIAKEGHKGDRRSMIFLMEKRGAGYDAENGNWWYATLTTSGKVMNAGRVASCISCHDNADNDYVYGNPK